MHTISPIRLSPRRRPVIWLVLLVTVAFLFSRVDRCSHTISQSIQSTFLSPSTLTVSTETTQPGSNTHGFNLFDNLYLRNGTFYIVTSTPSSFMPRNHIVSRPTRRGEGIDIQATDQELQFLTPAEAKGILGDRAISIAGFSVIFHDPSQFMSHFYHWWGELILGTFRVYSTLQQARYIAPTRFLLPNVAGDAWRDGTGLNGPLMRAAFPSSPIENADWWADILRLGSSTFVFERAMLVDRAAAHKSPLSRNWHKMISSTMELAAPSRFWDPIRETIVGNLVDPDLPPPTKPVVTYITRQTPNRRRKLSESSHESLLSALRELQKEGVCEVQVVEETEGVKLVELVARSTVIIGVHGSGLTHQLWMPPSPLSTIIEIFFPNAYSFDHEMIARNLGHRHYAVWNDTLLTYPEGRYHPKIKYAEHLDFRGSEMPVHGPAVAAAIRARLQVGSGVEPESVMHLDESHQMALALDSGREVL